MASLNLNNIVKKIIAAFPATGKTTVFQNQENYGLNILDSDSSHYSWLYNEDGSKVRHPNFPQNYIDHINDNIDKVDVIFVSSHDVVRDALVEAGIDFTLVYPDISLKGEYVERYINRGNPPAFVNLVKTNWETWIAECDNQDNCTKVVLKSGQYIADVMGFLMATV